MKSFASVLCALAACFLASAAETHFSFKENGRANSYRVEEGVLGGARLARAGSNDWIEALAELGNRRVQLGSRLVVQVHSTEGLEKLLAAKKLTLVRALGQNAFILQASDALTALQVAQELSADENFTASAPVMRRFPKLHSYAYAPNDPLFTNQLHLENRAATGTSLGMDLNVRAAWPIAQGDGVVIGVADDGIDLDHPDLQSRVANTPHFNFITGTTNGAPDSAADMHATAVAGLIAAEKDNNQGVVGIAPRAKLASWKIFGGPPSFPSDDQMGDMFQYEANTVAVQNHSWGYGGTQQQGPSLPETIGISNAVHAGRGGLGVVMVRSAGNERGNYGNANDDGYLADPNIIAVAAVRGDGRASKYSNPGACLLVAAPSGEVLDDGVTTDPAYPTLTTTDRVGAAGYVTGDYAFGAGGFSGTSGSAPQISGIVALLLSANPALSIRDVQQLLIQSARHFDLNDPGLATNAAGFRFSHNVGFGIPDAGFALALAGSWSNRPPASRLILTLTNVLSIPDDGMRVELTDSNAPPNLKSLAATPGLGLHADSPTAAVPLVNVGTATGPIGMNLSGKAALIQRGVNTFVEKIQFAADAGAAFAVVYNNRDSSARLEMGNTDYSPIPAVFVNQTDGETLASYLQQTNAEARLFLRTARYGFNVTNTWISEYVGVRVKTDHLRRSDVRITLTSPHGTTSVLQRLNGDTTSPGPVDWSYYSAQHFYEGSAGEWSVAVSDEAPGVTGAVKSVSLILQGIAITDTDGDGLDDAWELRCFGNLGAGATSDFDGDGFSNCREQILGTDPTIEQRLLRVSLTRWNNEIVRLSWPGKAASGYQVQGGDSVSWSPLATNVAGTFPETEWFVPYTNAAQKFFRIRQTLPP